MTRMSTRTHQTPEEYRASKVRAGQLAHAPKINLDVETMPCPGPTRGGQPHQLANEEIDGNAVTLCIWCGTNWVDLDAQARAAGATRTGAKKKPDRFGKQAS